MAIDQDERKGKSEPVSILVIESNREMQRLLRTMLSSYGMREVRIFNDSQRAASSMLSDPPRLVLIDWDATPYDGPSFLKLFRNKNMYPVCLVPIIVMLPEARERMVERAMKLAAHAIVVKPMSPAVLNARIKWVLAGHQTLRLDGSRYVIDGVQERLAVEHERQKQMESAREYQASQFAEMMSIQSDVDRILQVSI